MARRVFCDICNKCVNRWYKVVVTPEGINPNSNIAPLLRNTGNFDICQDCLETAITCMKERKDQNGV